MPIRVPRYHPQQQASNQVDYRYTYGPPIPPMNQNVHYLRESLWCMTYYFNPFGMETRYQNFLLFHQRLVSQTENILVIEVALDEDQFVLHNIHDETKLIQIVDTSLIWQKERLFNHCLSILPPSCTKVVWLDCDILFDNPEWLLETSNLLDHYVVVQPYYQNARLPSLVRNIDHGVNIDTFYYGYGDEQRCDGDIHGVFKSKMRQPWWGHPGYAYGYQRALLEEHGLYDRCITGSSDTLTSQAVIGKHDESKLVHEFYNEQSIENYLAWARPFHYDIGLSINFVRNANVFHLYHGQTKNRGYFSRLEFLDSIGFDYGSDIEIDPSNGCYRLTVDQTKKDLIYNWLQQYYGRRGDDEKEISE